MESSQKLEKYFRAIFICVALLAIIGVCYYQFVFLPHKKANYVRQITPTVVEERSTLTPAENKEMRAAYEEIMQKKNIKPLPLVDPSAKPAPLPPPGKTGSAPQ